MTIVNHKLSGASWVPTVHKGRRIKPSLIVVHESGTSIGKGNCVRYCRRNKRKVAYHIVIERDGTIVQMAHFDRKLNHAGKSVWKGRKWCNSYSIGVALVGPTELKGTTQSAKAYYGRVFTAKDGLSDKGSKAHGHRHIWLKHTSAQLKALQEVVDELRDEYPGIDVAAHYEVSPKRKIDPSPLVDMDMLRTPIEDRPSPLEEAEANPQEDDSFLGEPEVIPQRKNIKKFKKSSRKMRFTDTCKKVVLSAVPAGFFSWSTISQVKEFVNDNAGFLLLGMGVLAYLVFKYFEVRQTQDYEEGRYIPSEYEGKEELGRDAE